MAKKIPNLEARSTYKERLMLGLILRPMRLFCDHCDKYIPSDMPWQCPYCDQPNTKTRLYSFLTKCASCKRSPTAYLCLHCEKTNYLDGDEDAAYAARSISTNQKRPVEMAVENPREKKRREHDERKEDLAGEIEIAELTAKLAKLKAAGEVVKQESAKEKLMQSFANHEAQVLGAHEIAREQKSKNAEKYKNDPELREMADQAVDHWLQNQL